MFIFARIFTILFLLFTLFVVLPMSPESSTVGYYLNRIIGIEIGKNFTILLFLGVSVFLCWFSFFQLQHITPRAIVAGSEKGSPWKIRILYIPVILFLFMAVYAAYMPSNKDSPFYKTPTEIERECVMDGYGNGSCTFTNGGDMKGYLCGYIELTRRDGSGSPIKSGKLCSGNLEGHSTIKQEFEIIGIQNLCVFPNGEKWGDICSFSFLSDGK